MGFPATAPEAVVVSRLASQVGSLVSGTNLFRGPERPPAPASGMPHLAVFVRQYGGRNSTNLGNDAGERYYRIQVLVRGNVDGRAEAITLAESCLSACNRVDPTETGYIWLTSSDAGWVDLGVDDTEHPRLVFNAQLTYSG